MVPVCFATGSVGEDLGAGYGWSAVFEALFPLDFESDFEPTSATCLHESVWEPSRRLLWLHVMIILSIGRTLFLVQVHVHGRSCTSYPGSGSALRNIGSIGSSPYVCSCIISLGPCPSRSVHFMKLSLNYACF